MRRRLLLIVPLALGVVAALVVGVQALTGSGEPSATTSPSASDTNTPPGTLASGNNVVVLTNTHDGKTETKYAGGLAKETGDTVDNSNAAYAFSRCTDCRTVAIAVQVVLAMGETQTVTPKNLAIAENQQCTRCTSMAWAYQYVATTNGVVYISGDAQRRLQALDGEIKALIDENLDFATTDRRLDSIVAEVWQIVGNELQRAGKPAGSVRKTKDLDTGSSPSPTPTDTTASESPSPSLSPTSEPSDSASPSPTATATAAVVAFARRRRRGTRDPR